MAEPLEAGPRPLIGNRVLVIAVSAVLLFSFLFLIWSMRGCIPGTVEKGYTRIYSNLELADSAKVIARLKEMKIPFEVQQKGTAISVPKEKADEARLGLAEKSLPAGGMVGWEIFNETRMGATDFDRRIQLIRAISGELSRNIRRIEGVEDARVQIVIPETRLFEVTKAPVTAAVLIKLAPGARLRPEQISGIVHLTASSVENLKPENVTVVDESGTILSQKATETIAPPTVIPEMATPETAAPPEQQVVKKEEIKVKEIPVVKHAEEKKAETVKPTAEAAIKLASPPPRPLTPEEKMLVKLKAKEEYERQLTAKIQDLLNQYYPPNGAIIKVIVEFGSPQAGQVAKLKIKSNAEIMAQPIKRIKVFVLIDNKVMLNEKLKKNTYQAVSEVIAYNRARGDRIILKKVPFHYAVNAPFAIKPKSRFLPIRSMIISVTYVIAGLGLVLVVYYIFRPRKKKQTIPYEGRPIEDITAPPTETEAISVIDEIKKMAGSNPERIADLLKKWLTEEK